jgi:hypothetical protein
MTDPSTPPVELSVPELIKLAHGILTLVRAKLGPRSAAILMVGMPHGDHDNFAAQFYGPCLSARGLLAWGERSITAQIDRGDWSFNLERAAAAVAEAHAAKDQP